MLKLMIPALLLSAFVPNVALAQDNDHVAIHVAYRDLDLRTDMGATTLRKRVKDTAIELCKELGDTETRSTSIIPTCEEVAVGAASWDVRRVITAARQESAAR